MTEQAEIRNATESYIVALERFSMQTLSAFLSLCAPDIEFRDPFNHTFNRDDFHRVLDHMLDQVEGLGFVVSKRWYADSSAVIGWRFTGNARFIGKLDIPGLSEVSFNDDLLVCRHIDYWDANEHIITRLPVLGSAVRLATRPMSV